MPHSLSLGQAADFKNHSSHAGGQLTSHFDVEIDRLSTNIQQFLNHPLKQPILLLIPYIVFPYHIDCNFATEPKIGEATDLPQLGNH